VVKKKYCDFFFKFILIKNWISVFILFTLEAQEAEEQGEEEKPVVQDESAQAVKNIFESKESRAASAKAGISSPKAAIYYTTHQGAYHSPLSVSLMGDAVTLEDGSIWAVSGSDSYKTF